MATSSEYSDAGAATTMHSDVNDDVESDDVSEFTAAPEERVLESLELIRQQRDELARLREKRSQMRLSGDEFALSAAATSSTFENSQAPGSVAIPAPAVAQEAPLAATATSFSSTLMSSGARLPASLASLRLEPAVVAALEQELSALSHAAYAKEAAAWKAQDDARALAVKQLEQEVEAAVALVSQERRQHEAQIAGLEAAMATLAKQKEEAQMQQIEACAEAASHIGKLTSQLDAVRQSRQRDVDEATASIRQQLNEVKGAFTHAQSEIVQLRAIVEEQRAAIIELQSAVAAVPSPRPAKAANAMADAGVQSSPVQSPAAGVSSYHHDVSDVASVMLAATALASVPSGSPPLASPASPASGGDFVKQLIRMLGQAPPQATRGPSASSGGVSLAAFNEYQLDEHDDERFDGAVDVAALPDYGAVDDIAAHSTAVAAPAPAPAVARVALPTRAAAAATVATVATAAQPGPVPADGGTSTVTSSDTESASGSVTASNESSLRTEVGGNSTDATRSSVSDSGAGTAASPVRTRPRRDDGDGDGERKQSSRERERAKAKKAKKRSRRLRAEAAHDDAAPAASGTTRGQPSSDSVEASARSRRSHRVPAVSAAEDEDDDGDVDDTGGEAYEAKASQSEDDELQMALTVSAAEYARSGTGNRRVGRMAGSVSSSVRSPAAVAAPPVISAVQMVPHVASLTIGDSPVVKISHPSPTALAHALLAGGAGTAKQRQAAKSPSRTPHRVSVGKPKSVGPLPLSTDVPRPVQGKETAGAGMGLGGGIARPTAASMAKSRPVEPAIHASAVLHRQASAGPAAVMPSLRVQAEQLAQAKAAPPPLPRSQRRHRSSSQPAKKAAAAGSSTAEWKATAAVSRRQAAGVQGRGLNSSARARSDAIRNHATGEPRYHYDPESLRAEGVGLPSDNEDLIDSIRVKPELVRVPDYEAMLEELDAYAGYEYPGAGTGDGVPLSAPKPVKFDVFPSSGLHNRVSLSRRVGGGSVTSAAAPGEPQWRPRR